MSKYVYINLNNVCNSNCKFCGADIRLNVERKEINVKQFLEIVEELQIGPSDFIALNGGEPTLDNSLKQKLDIISSLRCNSSISTNGRRFSDFNYAKFLLKGFEGMVLFPLYGNNASSHDYWTEAPGSFEETISGINNCFRLIFEFGFPFTIELKLLYFRKIDHLVPKIFEFIIERFPYQNIIVSLNTLVWNNRNMTAKEDYLYDFKIFYNAINETINHLNKFKGKIYLRSIPLCFIDESKHDLVLKKMGPPQPIYPESYLFDPAIEKNNHSIFDGKEDWSLSNTLNCKFHICNRCPNKQICDFTSLSQLENKFELFLDTIGMLN